jgi:hypothetical protein
VELGVGENVQVGAAPPVAGYTDSLRVVPERVITCLSGVGLTSDPLFERNEIDVGVLPFTVPSPTIGVIRGATQAE